MELLSVDTKNRSQGREICRDSSATSEMATSDNGDDTPKVLLDYLSTLGVDVSLRNGSVHIQAPAGLLLPEIKDKLRRHRDAIRLELQRRADPLAALPSTPGLRAPLAPWQRGFWLMHCRPDSDPGVLHLGAALRIRGSLDTARLRAALNALGHRHGMLRARFVATADGNAEQYEAAIGPELDLSEIDTAAEIKSTNELIAHSFEQLTKRRFDLANDSPVRFHLITINNLDHRLLFVGHHIALDGWSIGLLLRDLFDLYESPDFAQAPQPTISFFDCAQHLDDMWKRPEARRRIAAAGNTLARLPLCQALPTDRRRGVVTDAPHGQARFIINGQTCAGLRAIADGARSSLYAAVLTCVAVVYRRLAGRDRLTVMAPVSNRGQSPALEPLVGCLANAVVVAPKLRPETSFRQAVADVASQIAEPLDAADLPFDDCLDAAAIPPLAGAYPGAQIVVALQNAAAPPRSKTLAIDLTDLPPLGRQDFFVEFRPGPSDDLLARVNYDGRLYTAATAEAFATAIRTIAETATAHPGTRVSKLPLGTPPATLSRGKPRTTDAGKPDGSPLSIREQTLAGKLAATARPGETALCVCPVGLDRLAMLRAAERAGLRLLALPATLQPADAMRLIAESRATVFIAPEDLEFQCDVAPTPPSWTGGLCRVSSSPAASLPEQTQPERLMLGVDGLIVLRPGAVRRRQQAAIRAVDRLLLDDVSRVGIDLQAASDEATELLEGLVARGVVLVKQAEGSRGIDLLLSTRARNPADNVMAATCVLINHLSPGLRSILGTPAHGLIAWCHGVEKPDAFAPIAPLQDGLQVLTPDGNPTPADLPGRLAVPCEGPDRRTPSPRETTQRRGPDAKAHGDGTLSLRVDPLAARTAWFGGRYVDFEVCAGRLIDAGGFADAELSLHDGEAGPALVAWVCPVGSADYEATALAARKALAGHADIDHVVRLATIPRDIDGCADRHRLALMSVAAPTVFNSLAAARTLSIRAIAREPEIPRRHIGDLLPTAGQRGICALPVFDTTDSQHDRRQNESGSGPAVLAGPALETTYPTGGWNPVDWLIHAAQSDRRLRTLDHDGTETLTGYAALLNRAYRIAAGFAAADYKPGDVVVLAPRRPTDFLASFFGAMVAGVTVAPVPHPRDWQIGDAAFDRLIHVARLAGARALVVNEAEATLETSRLALSILMVDNLDVSPATSQAHRWTKDETVLVSFTSGSTGAAKGVPLSAENIWIQPAAIGPKVGFAANETALNFTSLDHVASLIGFCAGALQNDCHLGIVSVERFLADPDALIDRLADWQVARSWAPDFAWSLVADLLDRRAAKSLDLRALRTIWSAGECPLARTFSKLSVALARHGANDVGLLTSWGMAETTSFLTLSAAWNGADAHLVASGVIDSGTPGPATEARVVGPDGRPLAEYGIGRFQVRGRQVFDRYIVLGEDGAARRRSPFTEDGWMETGDLAFIAQGRVMLLGREKDVLILNGQNIAQAAIEDMINGLDGVDPGFTAVVASRNARTGEAALIIFFCPIEPQPSPDDLAALVKRLSGAVAATYGVRPDYVLPVGRDEIAKTGLGKIQRPRLRKAFEAGHYAALIRRLDLLLANDRCVEDRMAHWVDQPMAVWSGRALSPVLLLDDGLGAATAVETELRRLGAVALGVDASATMTAEVTKFIQNGAIIVDFPAGDDSPEGLCAEVLRRATLVQSLARRTTARLRFLWVERHDRNGIRFDIGQSLSASLWHELANVASQSLDVASLINPRDVESLALALLSPVGVHVNGLRMASDGTLWCRKLAPMPEPRVDEWSTIRSDALILVAGGLGELGQVLLPQLLAWTDWRFLIIGRRSGEDAEAILDRLGTTTTANRLMYRRIDAGDTAALTDLCAAQEIDGVVNLTGAVERTPLTALSVDDLRAAVTGRMRVAEALATAFRGQALPIVHITSVNADLGRHDFLAYSIANAAHKHWLRRQSNRDDAPRHIDLTCGQWTPPAGPSDVNRHLVRLGFPLIDGRMGAIAVIRAMLGCDRQIVLGLDPEGPDIRPYAAGLRGPVDTITVTPRQGCMTTEAAATLRRFAEPYRLAVAFEDTDGHRTDTQLSETEQQVHALWKEILSTDRDVSPDANFFDAGGTSLLVARLQLKLYERFGAPDAVLTLFSHATIRAQARLVSAGGPNSSKSPAPSVATKADRRKSTAMAQRRRSARAASADLGVST